MKTLKTKYVAPLLELVTQTVPMAFMDAFSNGDPQDTGITIDTQGDDGDDDNFANQQTGFWEEE